MKEQQELFVQEYLVDLNATQAAIRAGYSTRSAGAIGCELLKKPNIRARIDSEMAKLSRRTGVNQERVVRELAKIAFANPTDIIDLNTGEPREDAQAVDTAAISSIRVKKIPTECGDGIEREIRMADKLKALELLGKHIGMFAERLQVSGDLGVTIVDDIKDDSKDGE